MSMSPFVQEVYEALQALDVMKGYTFGTPRQHPNAAIAIVPVNGHEVQITLREWQVNRDPDQRLDLLTQRMLAPPSWGQK